MKEGQPALYYVTAPTRETAERSPHLEAFRARGYEVLFVLDPIDELWLRLPREFEGKKLVSVAKSAVDLAWHIVAAEHRPVCAATGAQHAHA